MTWVNSSVSRFVTNHFYFTAYHDQNDNEHSDMDRKLTPSDICHSIRVTSHFAGRDSLSHFRQTWFTNNPSISTECLSTTPDICQYLLSIWTGLNVNILVRVSSAASFCQSWMYYRSQPLQWPDDTRTDRGISLAGRHQSLHSPSVVDSSGHQRAGPVFVSRTCQQMFPHFSHHSYEFQGISGNRRNGGVISCQLLLNRLFIVLSYLVPIYVVASTSWNGLFSANFNI